MATGLLHLPVELLYELQLCALSESLPLVCHHFYDVFKHASHYFIARYILGRILRGPETPTKEEAYTKALRYPICNRKVLGVLGNSLKDLRRNGSTVPLPRYLFKSLQPPEIGWNKEDHPIPTLRYLYQDPNIPPIDSNAHGYALARAVHARFVPLIQFLLDHNASPRCRKNLAVEVAIRQKDLEMVKLLVERPQSTKKNGKRRKVEDRVKLDSSLLKTAVMANAQDIVRYLYTEKGVIPDVETLKRLSRLDQSYSSIFDVQSTGSIIQPEDVDQSYCPLATAYFMALQKP